MKPVINPVLQAKFLQHLNKKKKGDEGFTLIELLVVVIIIGVLAAIALPSLLNQVSKARQSEAKQNIGAMNRAQQAFFLENSNKFTTLVSDLAIGVKTQSDNYVFEIGGDANGAVNKASTRQPKLKSYAGIVYTQNQTVNGVVEPLTLATLCEANTPNTGTADTQQTVTPGSTITGACSDITTPTMKSIK
jgi:type IV pilus assembly protein PilA